MMSAHIGCARRRAVPADADTRAGARVPACAGAAAPAPPGVFEDYRFECHGTDKPKADLSIERLLLGLPSSPRRGELAGLGTCRRHARERQDAAEGGDALPDGCRTPRRASAGFASSFNAYESEHAGEPGRVTVRRLTSAEYAYALRDLTGIDLKVGIDASSDSVGGEGFANFGDVQFVQDASIERYLEAAKLVADHAVVGAGPLDFFPDAGKTGLELSALHRIDELYATQGLSRRVRRRRSARSVSIATARRSSSPGTTSTARRSAIRRRRFAGSRRRKASPAGLPSTSGRWSTSRTPAIRSRTTVDGWIELPAPTADVQASIAMARAGCDALYKTLTTWPSWFFARGDLAAGGAGDESPLVFDDTSLKAEPTHHFTYALGPRAGRGRGAPRRRRPVEGLSDLHDVNPARA